MRTLDLSNWRLIFSNPAPGAWNMAIDETILEFAGNSKVQPTLRLYAWDPPCLSLGYAQPSRDVDRTALDLNGWHLVRRPTGGRAILHTDELTYSVIGPASEPRLAGSVLESYQLLSRALLAVLQSLGISAQATNKENSVTPPSSESNPVCFEAPSYYEITFNGKKLIGSAQARRKDGILQHGTLPLCGDLTRITQALFYPDPEARKTAAERLLERAITVEGAINREILWDTVARAFSEAFASTLNIQFTLQDLTESEKARAEELVSLKYANPDWTYRV
jgi:lipoate-protein ligase A